VNRWWNSDDRSPSYRSQRVPSSTRLLVDQLTEAARNSLAGTEDSVEVRHVEVRDHGHAIVDALLTGVPGEKLAVALRNVADADALVVITPTFQASYSGLFKSFIDLIGMEDLRGTPVLLAASVGTERHSLALEHALRPLFVHLGALSVPTAVYAASSDFGGDGASALAGRVARAATELATLVTGPRCAGPRRMPLPRSPILGTAGRRRRAGTSRLLTSWAVWMGPLGAAPGRTAQNDVLGVGNTRGQRTAFGVLPTASRVQPRSPGASRMRRALSVVTSTSRMRPSIPKRYMASSSVSTAVPSPGAPANAPCRVSVSCT